MGYSLSPMHNRMISLTENIVLGNPKKCTCLLCHTVHYSVWCSYINNLNTRNKIPSNSHWVKNPRVRATGKRANIWWLLRRVLLRNFKVQRMWGLSLPNILKYIGLTLLIKFVAFQSVWPRKMVRLIHHNLNQRIGSWDTRSQKVSAELEN